MIEIRQYVDRAGRNAFERWFEKLDEGVQARVTVYLDRLERGNSGSVKAIGGMLSELRLDFGPGYRVYFGWDGEKVVILLAGGTKRRQPADIQRARALWAEYLARKEEQNGADEEL
ncbi:MAG TPA: type II toxin-antitoxin system RelE/ParE family toxin [Acidobacteriaceae bacterium]|nr:type II toxin-antitoxin system RelE/ParE family toxin [Acidobacteriaceae bacterium]